MAQITRRQMAALEEPAKIVSSSRGTIQFEYADGSHKNFKVGSVRAAMDAATELWPEAEATEVWEICSVEELVLLGAELLDARCILHSAGLQVKGVYPTDWVTMLYNASLSSEDEVRALDALVKTGVVPVVFVPAHDQDIYYMSD
jgi:non-ribosomal peptide synthetase component E (peptide arylation enzyme)